MGHVRMLKPGFFRNEELAELPFETRLCFAGLWTLADREGRLEDRPRRVKGELFPYDAVDITAMLTALACAGFIRRYVVEGTAVIEIVRFKDHQRPHPREQSSELPAYQPLTQEVSQGTERVPPRTVLQRAEDAPLPSVSSVSSVSSGSVGPSAPKAAHTRTSGGVLEGQLPRDHLRHALCGRVCLHTTQFVQFVQKLGGQADAADAAVRSWAGQVLREWNTPPKHAQPIQGTTFQWWDARWEEWQGRPTAARRLTEDPAAMNAGVLELLKKDGAL